MGVVSANDIKNRRIIDVRTRPEYEQEHIPKSIHVPLHKISRYADSFTQQDIFLCRTGKRALVARKTAGVGDVLEGGINAYKHAQKPVTGQEYDWPIDRQVRTIAGGMILISTILGFLISQYWLLIAAFFGAGLLFAGITKTCGMAKLLARLPVNSRSDKEISANL